MEINLDKTTCDDAALRRLEAPDIEREMDYDTWYREIYLPRKKMGYYTSIDIRDEEIRKHPRVLASAPFSDERYQIMDELEKSWPDWRQGLN
ncbi:MAG TPA: hypothetical protein VHA56_16205 [Mucilaginibacter sp.]|nr:hypothetical protein [Mucilaginibacter sp.]